MSEIENSNTKSREHLANERTFLAWIRTSIALMGFGFVIVKFGLFLKQISFILEERSVTPSKGFSAVVGVVMVGLGILIAIFAFWQLRVTGKQINNDSYVPSNKLSVFLTLAILIGGILLILYLLPNI